MSRIVPEFSEEQRLALVDAARAMLGRPFRHQGRTLKGMDCIGFLGMAVAAVAGIEIQPRTDYGRTPSEQKLESELTAYLGEPISGRLSPDFELRPAQVVTCTWAIEASHVAIVVPHPEYRVGLIHCYRDARKVVEHGIDAIWRARITGVWQP